MKFIDVAEIQVRAGDGGQGIVHFRKEKYVPFGAPDGGNGAEGGSVFLMGDSGLSTLLDFRYVRHYEADDGGKGGTNNREGKRGSHKVLRVPLGTVAYDEDSNEMIGEVLRHEEQLLVAKGGQGGVGNAVFTNSRNQSPTKTVPPGCGEKRTLRLELKMLADVGIVGAPNAGKSTLITVVSAARPKVADYPFTTLVPTLGVVKHKEAKPFVIADVPGLIPGASEGKGLGHDFLRHIERTRLIVHLIDGARTAAEMQADYEAILTEMSRYEPELLERPRLTVLSKADVVLGDPELQKERADFEKFLRKKSETVLSISSALREGIPNLLDKIVEQLVKMSDLDVSMEELLRKP
jgi:GTP-binding protein